MWIAKDTKERIISMFDEIVTNDEVKFNDLEKKYLNLYVRFGCLILRSLW